jgi:2-iminobutanoate/2-iminopropanoate deaminase
MRQPVATPSAPKAIGPYSQAIASRGARTVWLSGQIPLDPATGELVPGDVVAQATRVMANLGAVLAAAGASFEHVVRCTIYLVDLADFAKVNEVYARSFRKDPPARATVQVAALPRGARVEIDAIAVVEDERVDSPGSVVGGGGRGLEDRADPGCGADLGDAAAQRSHLGPGNR